MLSCPFFTIPHLLLRSFTFALCDAVIQPDREVGAQRLENLYEDDEQNDGDIEDLIASLRGNK